LAEERIARSGHFQVLELGQDGRFIDQYRGREPVSWPDLSSFLDQAIVIPPDVTDIFVWVHGWRNDKITKAAGLADQVFRPAERLYQAQPERYPALRHFSPAYILVNWPSSSGPTYWGYKRVRDRAHAMTEHGHASRVLAFLLGYLDRRRGGVAASNVLRLPGGQYLHCVGHSFGGRFLAQAVIDAANPDTAMLPLLPVNPHYQFTVDNLLVFQMAAPPDIFGGRFGPLLEDAPLQGPVCLTFQPARPGDRPAARRGRAPARHRLPGSHPARRVGQDDRAAPPGPAVRARRPAVPDREPGRVLALPAPGAAERRALRHRPRGVGAPASQPR